MADDDKPVVPPTWQAEKPESVYDDKGNAVVTGPRPDTGTEKPEKLPVKSFGYDISERSLDGFQGAWAGMDWFKGLGAIANMVINVGGQLISGIKDIVGWLFGRSESHQEALGSHDVKIEILETVSTQLIDTVFGPYRQVNWDGLVELNDETQAIDVMLVAGGGGGGGGYGGTFAIIWTGMGAGGGGGGGSEYFIERLDVSTLQRINPETLKPDPNGKRYLQFQLGNGGDPGGQTEPVAGDGLPEDHGRPGTIHGTAGFNGANTTLNFVVDGKLSPQLRAYGGEGGGGGKNAPSREGKGGKGGEGSDISPGKKGAARRGGNGGKGGQGGQSVMAEGNHNAAGGGAGGYLQGEPPTGGSGGPNKGGTAFKKGTTATRRYPGGGGGGGCGGSDNPGGHGGDPGGGGAGGGYIQEGLGARSSAGGAGGVGRAWFKEYDANGAVIGRPFQF